MCDSKAHCLSRNTQRERMGTKTSKKVCSVLQEILTVAIPIHDKEEDTYVFSKCVCMYVCV